MCQVSESLQLVAASLAYKAWFDSFARPFHWAWPQEMAMESAAIKNASLARGAELAALKEEHHLRSELLSVFRAQGYARAFWVLQNRLAEVTARVAVARATCAAAEAAEREWATATALLSRAQATAAAARAATEAAAVDAAAAARARAVAAAVDAAAAPPAAQASAPASRRGDRRALRRAALRPRVALQPGPGTRPAAAALQGYSDHSTRGKKLIVTQVTLVTLILLPQLQPRPQPQPLPQTQPQTQPQPRPQLQPRPRPQPTPQPAPQPQPQPAPQP